MTRIYPIKLIPSAGEYVVEVPDLHISTQGSDIADAIFMARDAICMWAIAEEDAGRLIPEPSSYSIECKDDEISTLVDVDIDAYRRTYEQRTVRKNVTIPSWLNERAEKEHINFSEALQTALKNKLGI